MATTARFAAGGSSSPPTPTPATSPPAQTQATQLIVLPASLHQVIATFAHRERAFTCRIDSGAPPRESY
jgi:hypothetical protein